MSTITDKVVVITGASSGIGESTAKLLAEHRAKVVLGARRSNRIGAVVQEISASGGKAIGFATDVTKRVEVEALIQQAVDSFGRVDNYCATGISAVHPADGPLQRLRRARTVVGVAPLETHHSSRRD